MNRSRTAARDDVAIAHAGRVALPLLIALGGVSMLGPFSTDAFLPALPHMAGDLHATIAQLQLSLTGVTLGIAVGQLFAGPLSDGVGRRVPLLIGSAAMGAAALGAAFAPSLVVLVACCAALGLGASFGMVIGRAVISDLADGQAMTRAYAVLGTLIGLGPVLSPLFGVAVMALWGWRAVFVGLGVLAAGGFTLLATLVPESLPAGRRVAHPLRSLPRNAVTAFRSRAYVGGAIVIWFGFIAQFGYIAASAFLVQSVLGLSPFVYALTFGVNGLGLIAAGLLTARLSVTWTPRAIIALGLGAQGLGALIALVTTLTDTVTVWTMLPALFLLAASMGLVFAPATSVALTGLRHVAGTALAIIGAVQFVGAGIVSPLVALGGEEDPRPFAVIVGMAVAVAWGGWMMLGRGTVAAPAHNTELDTEGAVHGTT